LRGTAIGQCACQCVPGLANERRFIAAVHRPRWPVFRRLELRPSALLALLLHLFLPSALAYFFSPLHRFHAVSVAVPRSKCIDGSRRFFVTACQAALRLAPADGQSAYPPGFDRFPETLGGRRPSVDGVRGRIRVRRPAPQDRKIRVESPGNRVRFRPTRRAKAARFVIQSLPSTRNRARPAVGCRGLFLTCR
jgi:hypothetical protein